MMVTVIHTDDVWVLPYFSTGSLVEKLRFLVFRPKTSIFRLTRPTTTCFLMMVCSIQVTKGADSLDRTRTDINNGLSIDWLIDWLQIEYICLWILKPHFHFVYTIGGVNLKNNNYINQHLAAMTACWGNDSSDLRSWQDNFSFWGTWMKMKRCKVWEEIK